MTKQQWPEYRHTSPDGLRWAALTNDVIESEATEVHHYAQYKRSDLTVRTPGDAEDPGWCPLSGVEYVQAAFDALLPPLESAAEAPREMTARALTHQQAAILRAIKLANEKSRQESEITSEMIEMLPAGLLRHDGHTSFLSSDGFAALAKYDARFVTVEKSEFDRLEKLERKIYAFLGGAACDADACRIGAVSVSEHHHGLYWKIAGRTVEQSFGDALRQAFELFEVAER